MSELTKGGWGKKRIGEIVNFHSGFAFPEAEQGKEDGELGFFKVADMSRSENTRELRSAENRVSLESARGYGWSPCPEGAVAFAKVGAALLGNRRRLVVEPCIIDNNMLAVSAVPGVDPGWLYYAMHRVDFAGFFQSGAVPSVSQEQIGSFYLLTPPAEEQRKIAEVLDAVDEAVQAAERVIAKQENIKQGAINILLARRGLWSQSALSVCLSDAPRNGYSPSEVDEWTGVQVLGLGCLTDQGFAPRQLKNVPARTARLSGALLDDGDLLISRANTRELVGFAGRYRDIGVTCIYPDLMMRLRPNGCMLPDFMEYTLRHSYVRRQIQARAVGTSESMVKISSAIVRSLQVAVPDLPEQRRIVSVIGAHDARIAAERAQLDKLRKLKAGLMDDLLTGRVRVDQLEDLPV